MILQDIEGVLMLSLCGQRQCHTIKIQWNLAPREVDGHGVSLM